MSEKDREIFKLKILQARYLKAQLEMDEKFFDKAQYEFAKAYHKVCKTCPAHEREILEGAMSDPDQKQKKKANMSKAAKKAKGKASRLEDRPKRCATRKRKEDI